MSPPPAASALPPTGLTPPVPTTTPANASNGIATTGLPEQNPATPHLGTPQPTNDAALPLPGVVKKDPASPVEPLGTTPTTQKIRPADNGDATTDGLTKAVAPPSPTQAGQGQALDQQPGPMSPVKQTTAANSSASGLMAPDPLSPAGLFLKTRDSNNSATSGAAGPCVGGGGCSATSPSVAELMPGLRTNNGTTPEQPTQPVLPAGNGSNGPTGAGNSGGSGTGSAGSGSGVLEQIVANQSGRRALPTDTDSSSTVVEPQRSSAPTRAPPDNGADVNVPRELAAGKTEDQIRAEGQARAEYNAQHVTTDPEERAQQAANPDLINAERQAALSAKSDEELAWAEKGGWKEGPPSPQDLQDQKNAHAVLGAASYVPGYGIVPALLNAGSYAGEGDLESAGWAAVGAIPGAKLAGTGKGLLEAGGKSAAKYLFNRAADEAAAPAPGIPAAEGKTGTGTRVPGAPPSAPTGQAPGTRPDTPGTASNSTPPGGVGPGSAAPGGPMPRAETGQPAAPRVLPRNPGATRPSGSSRPPSRTDNTGPGRNPQGFSGPSGTRSPGGGSTPPGSLGNSSPSGSASQPSGGVGVLTRPAPSRPEAAPPRTGPVPGARVLPRSGRAMTGETATAPQARPGTAPRELAPVRPLELPTQRPTESAPSPLTVPGPQPGQSPVLVPQAPPNSLPSTPWRPAPFNPAQPLAPLNPNTTPTSPDQPYNPLVLPGQNEPTAPLTPHVRPGPGTRPVDRPDGQPAGPPTVGGGERTRGDIHRDGKIYRWDDEQQRWHTIAQDNTPAPTSDVGGSGPNSPIRPGFQPSDPAPPTGGADEPAKPTIGLYGFRGTGRDDKSWIETKPLIYAGHVGISLDGGKTIYGFTPYAPGLSFPEIIASLKDHVPYPGVVGNDTELFHDAQDLFEATGGKTRVYVWDQTFTPEEFERIQRDVFEERDRSPMSDKRYNFPDPKYPDCNNCATWPGTHGVELPEPTGELRNYIPRLIERGQPWNRLNEDH